MAQWTYMRRNKSVPMVQRVLACAHCIMETDLFLWCSGCLHVPTASWKHIRSHGAVGACVYPLYHWTGSFPWCSGYLCIPTAPWERNVQFWTFRMFSSERSERSECSVLNVQNVQFWTFSFERILNVQFWIVTFRTERYVQYISSERSVQLWTERTSRTKLHCSVKWSELFSFVQWTELNWTSRSLSERDSQFWTFSYEYVQNWTIRSIVNVIVFSSELNVNNWTIRSLINSVLPFSSDHWTPQQFSSTPWTELNITFMTVYRPQIDHSIL